MGFKDGYDHQGVSADETSGDSLRAPDIQELGGARSGNRKETAHSYKESQECGTPEGRRGDVFQQGAISCESCQQIKQMRAEN